MARKLSGLDLMAMLSTVWQTAQTRQQYRDQVRAIFARYRSDNPKQQKDGQQSTDNQSSSSTSTVSTSETQNPVSYSFISLK